MHLDTHIASTGPSICNLLASHFASVYDGTVVTEPWTKYLKARDSSNVLSSITISVDSVFKNLKSLDKNKGSGMDGIPSVFAVNCANCLSYPLCEILPDPYLQAVFQ